MKFLQRRRDRNAFRWWVRFERARLFELRRGWDTVALMAIPELAMWEGRMSPDWQRRAIRAQIRHITRARLRAAGASRPSTPATT